MASNTLNDIFLKSDIEKKTLFHALHHDPQITAYNRLEPRARTKDFTRSLRAEVRDPLWLLTRQWQMGELEAEDAGSAIDARLFTTQTRVDRVALGGEAGQRYDESLPLETAVEREFLPLDGKSAAFPHTLKVQVAQYFMNLHPPALRAAQAAKYRSAFPFDANAGQDLRGQTDGMNIFNATKSRDFDGQALLESIRKGSFAAGTGLAAGDPDGIGGLAKLLAAWFARQYSQPEAPGGSAWNASRLSYSVQAAAPRPDGSQFVLDAAHYHEGRLDWYSFDLDPNAAPLGTDDPLAAAPAATERAISFLPAAASFKGMPAPRFWEMENRQINLGQLNAKTTDPLLLLFAELGLVYGNDWFVIPYTMPVNTLCEITGLVVTDVFGERTLISAAGEGKDNDWQRWSMFSLSNKNEIGRYNRQFFLPAALASTLESEPIERVNYLRDEMANMAWAVEEIIPDATGKGISGHEAAAKIETQPPAIAASAASIRYVLGTTVPENWIPFLPVHKAGSNQAIEFRRAAMPKPGSASTDAIKPKGVLLTEKESPFYINEEEIPHARTLVRRCYQRARWYDGKTCVWIGRYRETGRGEGSSELQFDQIEPVKR